MKRVAIAIPGSKKAEVWTCNDASVEGGVLLLTHAHLVDSGLAQPVNQDVLLWLADGTMVSVTEDTYAT